VHILRALAVIAVTILLLCILCVCNIEISVFDVGFPTHLDAAGSDAVHTDPDYYVSYVIIKTDSEHEGHGFTFTIGRGTGVIVACVHALKHLVAKRYKK